MYQVATVATVIWRLNRFGKISRVYYVGDRGATITVDCVVIYTVDDQGRLTSIRAHWEPDRAMAALTAP